jgi:hypothetical protein
MRSRDKASKSLEPLHIITPIGENKHHDFFFVPTANGRMLPSLAGIDLAKSTSVSANRQGSKAINR